MTRPTVVKLILAVALVYVIQDGIHFNDESQQVVITQFGNPVGKPVTAPGLYFDLPLVQTENNFSKQALEYQSKPTQVPTRDKRYISVAAFALWRITDPLKFFQRVQNEAGAQARLDEIVAGEVRNAVARYDLIELVRTTTRQANQVTSPSEEEAIILTNLEKGRARLADEILQRSRERSADLGFEVLDFRFKHISYVEDVQKAVFARMTAERQRVAEQYRSEGQGEAARISGQRDRDLAQIQSEAYRAGEERRGKGDADATRIYAGAYGKDPDFYGFVKSLETYEKSFDPSTVLILDSSSDLLKYLGKVK
jgi:modulator of FtsH protease HflC